MPKRKKVMYLIGTLGHGRGGHFYSLRTIAEALNGTIEPYIVNIGKFHSPVIDSTTVNHTTIHFNGWNILWTIKSLLKIVSQEKPTVIHSFDTNAFLFAKIVSRVYNIPVIHTLCGGANPTGFYPHVENLILFSQENLDYFKALKEFQSSNIYLIPNRVNKIKSDSKRIDLLKKKVDSNRIMFLQIARFSKSYKDSMIQTINLIRLLSNKGFPVQLVFIGAVEDSSVYEEVVSYKEREEVENVCIVTDDQFTVNASELIDIADCVVGTGRGLMEAASKSKILFTPVRNHQYPILVTKDNFHGFFHTNFSPRNQLSDKMKKNNMEDIMHLFKNNHFEDARMHSKKIFDEYFDINSKKEVYKEIYEKTPFCKIAVNKNIEHFLRVVRNFMR